jgi:hypothetical protein
MQGDQELGLPATYIMQKSHLPPSVDRIMLFRLSLRARVKITYQFEMVKDEKLRKPIQEVS